MDLNAYEALYLKTLGTSCTLCAALIPFGLIIGLFMRVSNLHSWMQASRMQIRLGKWWLHSEVFTGRERGKGKRGRRRMV